MRSNRPVETLLIVGASPRAAAQSARRAGLQPVCIASFEDEDLAATARTVAWPRNLKELIRLAESLPPGPWMYTGALENRPGLIDA
ncbi:MAG: hypothetical protein GXP27_03640, partial [Planctomycetes bacterium]|nr:hypothetical protein [Planctomycetota bacterium]